MRLCVCVSEGGGGNTGEKASNGGGGSPVWISPIELPYQHLMQIHLGLAGKNEKRKNPNTLKNEESTYTFKKSQIFD